MESQAEVEGVSSGSELAHLLFMQFGVLRKILENLTARDLGRAAQVNHAWNNVCRIIRRERQCPHWFEWFSPHLKGKWKRTSARSKINEEMGRVLCVPRLCLFFSSEAINSIDYEDEDYRGVNLKRCRHRRQFGHNQPSSNRFPNVIEHLMKMMPNTCTTLGLRAYGTVGTAWDLSSTVELRDKTSFSVLMIPEISGVNIIPFVVERRAYMSLKAAELLTDEQLERLTGIPAGEEIHCLIISCNSFVGEEAAELIVQTLLKRMDNKMAVGGGIGDEFFISSFHSLSFVMGFAISGPSVQAVSAVIPQNVTKEAKIRETFEQLKSCDLPSENSIGFMFSCMGRCVRGPKRGKGTESNLFREYFPTVPLIGFYGSGEIGLNFMVPREHQDITQSYKRNSGPSLKKQKFTKVEVLHQYSSIFVLVSTRRGL